MKQNKLIVIVAVYNAIYDGKNYIKLCLDSIAAQTYKNYEVVVIDDCSTDGTWETINEYPFHKLRNPVRNHHGFYNQIQAMQYLPMSVEDIYVIVDGDDYLIDDHVFEDVNNMYQDGTLVTYGKLVSLSGGFGEFGSPDVNIKTYRRHGHWHTSHLKTFKKRVFCHIADSDLRYNDDYFKVAGDAALMYPMLEMVGNSHFKCADRVLYVYNDKHPPGEFHPLYKKEITYIKFHKPRYPRMLWK